MNNIELINQKFKYAVIKIFKGYSNILDKPSVIETSEKLLTHKKYNPEIISRFLDIKHEEEVSTSVDGESTDILMTKYDKNEPKYFYDNFVDSKKTKIVKLKNIGFLSNGETYGVYNTDNLKHIEKYHDDPLSDIKIITIQRSICKKGNNYIIKLEKTLETREFNKIKFKTQKATSILNFNQVTNNFTISSNSTNFYESVITSHKTNDFVELSSYFLGLKFGPLKDLIFSGNPLYGKYKKMFNMLDFIDVFNEVLNVNLCFYPKPNVEVTMARFCFNFINKRKIKVPNHYMGLFLNFYPTEKVLAKNGRKLIASILDNLGIKSNITIKKLHENPNIDLHVLYYYCKLFGDEYPKYIGNFKVPSYDKKRNQTYSFEGVKHLYNVKSELTKREKDNLMKLILLGDENFFTKLTDHITMYDEIKQFKPEVILNSITLDSFEREHQYFSKIRSLIKRNTLTKYVFNDKMVNILEEPITVTYNENEYKFFPYLLKREDEYDEEGKTMHHCVSSYVNREGSIIVSLRNDDKTDRVTSEFNVKNGICVQSRYFSNKVPPDYFEEPLKLLKKRMEDLSHTLTLKYIKKEKVSIVDYLKNY